MWCVFLSVESLYAALKNIDRADIVTSLEAPQPAACSLEEGACQLSEHDSTLLSPSVINGKNTANIIFSFLNDNQSVTIDEFIIWSYLHLFTYLFVLTDFFPRISNDQNFMCSRNKYWGGTVIQWFRCSVVFRVPTKCHMYYLFSIYQFLSVFCSREF